MEPRLERIKSEYVSFSLLVQSSLLSWIIPFPLVANNATLVNISDYDDNLGTDYMLQRLQH